MVNPISRAADAVTSATSTASGAADSLMQMSRTGGVLDTSKLAQEVADIAEASPAQAADILEALQTRLSPTDQRRFNEDFAAAIEPQVTAARTAAQPQPQTGVTGLTKAQEDLILDVGQIGLDIVGIFEPTPFADGANTVISALRGDGWGALMSAAGMIPYLGDTAKLGKVGRWVDTVGRIATEAASNPAFRRAVAPALEKIADALRSAPLDSLPASMREGLQSLRTKVDEALGVRLQGNTLVLDANRGTTATVGGRTVTVGDPPATPRVDAQGRLQVTDVEGNAVRVQQPVNYDSAVRNADGSITYTRGTRSATYDANGFPIFQPKAEVYLDARHINSGSSDDHFRAANAQLGQALRNNPGLQQQLGLTDAQAGFLTRQSADPAQASAVSPPGLTWHHHQDAGRMQLVVRTDHQAAAPHTGGMSIWGGHR
jgi:hypothetical protein